MRISSFLIALIIATLLTACRTPQAAEREIVYRTDTVTETKLVPVSMQEDSASVKAQLRCDSMGNVLIEALTTEQSKNTQLEFEIDKLNRLIAKFKTNPDTVYVPVTDTTINTTETNKEKDIVEVEVERKRTVWESFLIVCGLIGCVIFCIFVIIFIIKKKLKL